MANEIKALKRINELAALAKERELTPEEIEGHIPEDDNQ